MAEDRVKGIPVHHLEPAGENAFQQCAACGQAFDKRSKEQSLHHQKDGHHPLTEEEMAEFAQARSQAR